MWFEHLRRGLRKRGFKQSKCDECVFYKGETIFVVYVDDGIMIGPNPKEIDEIVKSLKEDYDLTDEGDLNEYLGIKIETKGGDEIAQLARNFDLMREAVRCGFGDEIFVFNEGHQKYAEGLYKDFTPVSVTV